MTSLSEWADIRIVKLSDSSPDKPLNDWVSNRIVDLSVLASPITQPNYCTGNRIVDLSVSPQRIESPNNRTGININWLFGAKITRDSHRRPIDIKLTIMVVFTVLSNNLIKGTTFYKLFKRCEDELGSYLNSSISRIPCF